MSWKTAGRCTVGWPASELFNVLLWCGVFLSCRRSPSKNHNLAKNKTKKKQLQPILLLLFAAFFFFALLFSCVDPVALQLSLLPLLFSFLLFFVSTPSRPLQRSHEIEVCRVFFFLWGLGSCSCLRGVCSVLEVWVHPCVSDLWDYSWGPLWGEKMEGRKIQPSQYCLCNQLPSSPLLPPHSLLWRTLQLGLSLHQSLPCHS